MHSPAGPRSPSLLARAHLRSQETRRPAGDISGRQSPSPWPAATVPTDLARPGQGDHGQGEMLSGSLVSSSRSVPGQSCSARGAAPDFLFTGSIHPQPGFGSALP